MIRFLIPPTVTFVWRVLRLSLGIALGLVTIARGQLPTPYMYLPLEAGNPSLDIVRSTTGTATGTAPAQDRFGRAGGCISFTLATGNVTPSSISGFQVGTHTTSFWTYIDNPSSIPAGENPFQDTDIEQQIYGFYKQIPDGSASTTILVNGMGMARKGATVGNQRLIEKNVAIAGITTKTIKLIPWYFWRNRPIQFDVKGWYHIVCVSTPSYNRIHMYKPDGSHSIGYDYLTTKPSLFNSFDFKVGNSSSNSNVIDKLDDFQLYQEALTDYQVEMLHNQQKVHSGTNGVYRLKNVDVVGGDNYLVADYGVDTNVDKDAMIKSENNAGSSMLWKINFPATDGTATIRWMGEFGNQKALNVWGGNTSDNAQVATWGGGESDSNSNWYFIRNSDGSYTIKNRQTNNFLGTYNGHTADGTTVRTRTSEKADGSTKWVIEQVDLKSMDDGYYRFKNRRSGLYFATGFVQYGTSISKTYYYFQAKQRAEDDAGATNIWRVKSTLNNGWRNYTIGSSTNADNFSAGSEWYVNLGFNRLSSGWSFDDGNLINTGDWNYGDELSWLIWKDTQGYYRIASYKHAKLLGVDGGSMSAGANIIQWGSGADNSQWTVDKVDMNPIRRQLTVGGSQPTYYIENIQAPANQRTVQSDDGNSTFYLGDRSSTRAQFQLAKRDDYGESYEISRSNTSYYWNVWGRSPADFTAIGAYNDTPTPSISRNAYWYIYRDSQQKLRIASTYSLQYARVVYYNNYQVQTCCIGRDGLDAWWNQWTILPTIKVTSGAAREAAVELAAEPEKMENNLTIFPNPTTGVVQARVQLVEAGPVTFSLFDARGALIHSEQKQLTEGTQTVTLQAAGLMPQVYTIKANTAAGQLIGTKKLILTK